MDAGPGAGKDLFFKGLFLSNGAVTNGTILYLGVSIGVCIKRLACRILIGGLPRYLNLHQLFLLIFQFRRLIIISKLGLAPSRSTSLDILALYGAFARNMVTDTSAASFCTGFFGATLRSCPTNRQRTFLPMTKSKSCFTILRSKVIHLFFI